MERPTNGQPHHNPIPQLAPGASAAAGHTVNNSIVSFEGVLFLYNLFLIPFNFEKISILTHAATPFQLYSCIICI